MKLHIACCGCGTCLFSCDSDALTKLALCLSCWRRKSSAAIIEASKEHQAKGHSDSCKGASRDVYLTVSPGTIAATYELDLLPGWRASTPADHEPNAPRPYADLPRWSGNVERGLPEPPAIGDLVFVTMNGFGYGRVTGYFVEHGWLGCYVKVEKPPAWWVKQNKASKRKTDGKFGGPMIFGAEMKKEGGV